MIERQLYPAGELDVAVPPGDTLAELMEERGLTRDAVCADCCLTPATLSGVLDGTLAITPEVAQQLECRFGTPARLWLNLQNDYDRARVQSDSLEALSNERANEYLVRLKRVMDGREGNPDWKQDLDAISAEAKEEAAKLGQQRDEEGN
jgi:addiction module HigA family antidote